MVALITEETAAKMLGVTRAKLQKDRWANTGVEYVKIGKSVRYTQEAVEAFITANTIIPTR